MCTLSFQKHFNVGVSAILILSCLITFIRVDANLPTMIIFGWYETTYLASQSCYSAFVLLTIFCLVFNLLLFQMIIKSLILFLGLTLTVGCASGLPAMFWSDYIVQKIGRSTVFFLSFIAYFIRFVGYSYIW